MLPMLCQFFSTDVVFEGHAVLSKQLAILGLELFDASNQGGALSNAIERQLMGRTA